MMVHRTPLVVAHKNREQISPFSSKTTNPTSPL
jgi:hypothetical protein